MAVKLIVPCVIPAFILTHTHRIPPKFHNHHEKKVADFFSSSVHVATL